MEINNRLWQIWDNTTFKITSYCRNFDLINDNESIISEHCGVISLTRLSETKPPIIIGEFEVSTWNIALGKKLNVNFVKLLKCHWVEVMYAELLKAVKNDSFDIMNYDKLILIQNLVIHPEFRKSGMTEEFVEAIYRQYYNEKNAIIAVVKPIQDNPVDSDYYYNIRSVEMRNSLDGDIKVIPSVTYYKLNEFLDKDDRETNEYKLFAVAVKCGLSRIGDGDLFMFSPEKILQRISAKREYNDKINSQWEETEIS
jgi:hypothetical protein